MISTAPIQCQCGNCDQNKFETVTGGYSAPRRDGSRGSIEWQGCRCEKCGKVHRLDDEAVKLATVEQIARGYANAGHNVGAHELAMRILRTIGAEKPAE